jgi:hypothetical protein
MQWQNAIADICPDQTTDLCKKLKEFFLIQLDWIYSQIDSFPNEEYWHQVFLEKIKKISWEIFWIYLGKFTSCSIKWSD